MAPCDAGSEGEAVTSLLRYGSSKEVCALIKKFLTVRDVMLQVSLGKINYGIGHLTTLSFFKGSVVVCILTETIASRIHVELLKYSRRRENEDRVIQFGGK